MDDNMLMKLEGQLQQIEIDFDFEVKRQLIRVIIGVENSNIISLDDNAVPVRLKDESIYAFAPRRFA